MGFFSSLFGSSEEELLKQMSDGIALVQLGVFVRLQKKLTKKYDEKYAGRLSASVVNVLFKGQLMNEKSKEFLGDGKNNEKVFKEIRNLGNDIEVAEMLTDAFRVKMVISAKKNDLSWLEYAPQHMKMLKDNNLFIVDRPQPTPAFINFAEQFVNY